ncbi:MAG: hypothetical protein CL885_01770 [Dehalococcoidia bacterium]|nr:hypothetical protein [Dehalococcoidia bacterium]|tara:strand:+ start:620 stop:925 length:306 start_codon:yes stop_codon:yes gene_type:complete
MQKMFFIAIIFISLVGCEKEPPIIIQTAPIICDPDKRELSALLGKDALSSKDYARLRHLSLKLEHSFLKKKPKDSFYTGHSRLDEYKLVPNPNFKMGPICQ